MSDNLEIKKAETVIPEWAAKLQEEIAKLQKDNEMLRGMAGKNTIASWEDARKDKTQKFAYLKKYNGKIVVGWGKLDYSNFNRAAVDALSEGIMMTLKYLDKTEEQVNYILFKNCNEIVNAKILHSNPEETLIEFPESVVKEFNLDNPTLVIATKYLNP